jgi:hypothetical protein
MSEIIDDDGILTARVRGRSVRRIAREHGMTEGAVDEVLDQRADAMLSGKHQRRALMLQLARLDELIEVFHPKALAGDPICGALVVKIEERRATLLGMNAPIGHAVSVVQHEPTAAPTSTDLIEAAFARIRRKRLPQPDGNGAGEAELPIP